MPVWVLVLSMPLLTGLLLTRYSLISTMVRYLGPLPVFDLLFWTARRVVRRKGIFISGLILGGCLVLGLSNALAS